MRFFKKLPLVLLSVAVAGLFSGCVHRVADRTETASALPMAQMSGFSGTGEEPSLVAERLSNQSPSLTDYMTSLARKELEEGKLDIAVKLFLEALRADPGNEEALEYIYWFKVAGWQPASKKKTTLKVPRIWYPTNPPRPASPE